MISSTSVRPLPDAYSIYTIRTQADVQIKTISIRLYSIAPRSIPDPFRFHSIAMTTRAYSIATRVYPIATRPYTSALTLNTFLQKRRKDQTVSHLSLGTRKHKYTLMPRKCKNRVLIELFVKRS